MTFLRRLYPLLAVGLFLNAPARAQQPTYRFSRDILAQWKKDSVWSNYQNYAVQFSQIGDYVHTLAAQSAYEKGRHGSDTNVRFDPAYLQRFHAVNARRELLKRTGSRQLVILNEAHYQPLNRVFTRSLLAGLYGQGFRYLCIEDLASSTGAGAPPDTGLNQRKYPLLTTGYYTIEPQYGELERQALALGFTLVPYEFVPPRSVQDFAERMVGRERGQAENIQQLLTKDPKARIVVHVGYGHLVENISPDGQFGFMAAFLKKNTGLDPFTIHQVDLLEHADATLDNPYRALMHAAEPSVYVDAQGALFNSAQDAGKWDASVYFPPTTYCHGRPTWLRPGFGRTYYVLPAKQITVSFPCQVRAYRAGEDVAVAVPVDVIELQSASEDRALVLGRGQFRLLLEDAKGGRQQLAATVR